jgi:predicted Zn-ribbon and HTH transcriptional regulator
LEVADIFRYHGPAWRQANAGHVSLQQLKVMSAIERCRTAELGGHVARCADCAYTTVAYNSCRNRHCPKCQGAAAKQWLADREAELLPVPLCAVAIYVLFGAKAQGYSALTSCLKEHNLFGKSNPLAISFREE